MLAFAKMHAHQLAIDTRTHQHAAQRRRRAERVDIDIEIALAHRRHGHADRLPVIAAPTARLAAAIATERIGHQPGDCHDTDYDDDRPAAQAPPRNGGTTAVVRNPRRLYIKLIYIKLIEIRLCG